MESLNPEVILEQALASLNHAEAASSERLFAALDSLPAPIYVTDKDGVVIYFNPPCIGFAGRKPVPGKDRWCVTWKLYTDEGVLMPHAACPMAVAIGERRPVRGVFAVAERPDGARVRFLPFPTPILDEAGALVGAVNMLIDVSEVRQIAELRAQASRCRRLAGAILDRSTVEVLTLMAGEYETKARRLEQAAPSAMS